MQANATFAGSRYAEALAQYEAALSYVDEDLLFQLEAHYLEQGSKARGTIQLNAAQCALRLRRWDAAEAAAGEAVKLLADGGAAVGGEMRVKALLRRAQARRGLGRDAGALDDLQAARKLCAPAPTAVLFGAVWCQPCLAVAPLWAASRN